MRKTMFGLLGMVSATLLASTAMADQVSGAGGPLNDGPSGGVWQTALPTNPFSSSAVVPVGVASINFVRLNGLTHTWMGDLQAVLYSPGGQGYNLFVRPGFSGAGFGNSGDFTGGPYTFRDPSMGDPGLPISGNAAAGNYRNGGATGAANGTTWTNGNLGISNTGLNSVSGASGAWTLKIYDWAGGDVGNLQSWDLNYNPVPVPGAVALLGVAGLVGSRRRRS